jgi:alpha-L-fucosidase
VSELAHSAFTGEKNVSDKILYLPPECDVAVRQHWFWQDDDLDTLKTTEHLLGIYYRSVGNGANLLLNLGPNRDGLLDEHDVNNLLEMRRELDERFAHPIVAELTPHESGFVADFGSEVSFDHLILNEALEDGQRVEGYRVFDADDGREITRGETIGYQKWHVFKKTTSRRLRIEIGPDSAPGAVVQSATAYLTGHSSLPQLGAPLDYSAWKHKADGRDCVVTKWRL